MRAVICGCGIAGLGLARLLVDIGWDVVAVERSNHPRGGDYAIDLWGAGFDVAEALGAVPELRRLALPIVEATFVNGRGRRVAGVDYRQLRAVMRDRLVTVLRGDLERVLADGLPNLADVRAGCTVRDFEDMPPRLSVTLSDGTRLSTDLLVGADGAHSVIRSRAFGPPGEYGRYLGFHVAAYSFTDPDLRARIGDRFWIPDAVGRFFALYGLPAGRIGVLAVHRSADRAAPPNPRSTLLQVHGDLGRRVANALERCPEAPDLYYDLAYQIEMSNWSCSRVVLVGDACGALSLVAGQGASLALAGARALARALAQVSDLETALRLYQERMLPVVRSRQAEGRRTAAWFVPSSPSRLRIRRTALRTLDLPLVGPRLLPLVFG